MHADRRRPGFARRLRPLSATLLAELLAALLFALLFATMQAHAAPADGEAAARALLAEQRDAWNRGDLASFMDGYWRSAELRFASGDRVQLGWDETLARYRRAYPDRDAMGRLSFELVEVRALGPDAVLVFGHWSLARTVDADADRPHGLFTLIVERKDDRWVVTRDHTSAAER